MGMLSRFRWLVFQRTGQQWRIGTGYEEQEPLEPALVVIPGPQEAAEREIQGEEG
ncbi:MAG: hypothetical protein ACREDR_11270 [Blastocatellia bacterium]